MIILGCFGGTTIFLPFKETPISAETCFHHEWNARPSSEKPWHWVPCRLVYGAKVHDLMPLQANLLSFLRGKNLATKMSAYFAKRMLLKQNTWRKNKHKMWYSQHIPSPKNNRVVFKGLQKKWWRKKRDSNHITYINPKPKGLNSWWFQPIWKILVKMGIFPR